MMAAGIRPLRHWWKPLSWIWLTLIIGGGINVGSSWLTSRQWNVDGTPLGWLLDHPLITFPLTTALLLVTGLAFLASAQDEKRQPVSPAPFHPALLQRNRERMRQHLKRWYQEFLDASLMQATWLDLGLSDKADALSTPISLVLRNAPFPERPLPAGTPISQVYDDAGQEVLLLGEPGAGKSTLLYTLAQQLLHQTDTDPTAPLPLIFALSTWAQREEPLEQWMVEQLVQFYQVPRTLARHWVATQAMTPLLDGLDEMEKDARSRCIAAINIYHQAHPGSLVVCSRSAEYAAAAQTHRLALQRAVVIQPLSDQQIAAILARGGRPLAGLRAACKDNAALHELLTSPLLLNLFLLVYRGVPVRTLPTTAAALQQQVFERYVQHMLARKGDPRRYPANQTRHWLAWLARQMQSRTMTQFGIEDLQPDWLAPRFQRRSRWSVVLLIGLLIGLGGLLIGLAGGLVPVLLIGLGGLAFGLVEGTQQSIELAERLQWSWRDARRVLVGGLFAGLVGGLLSGLIFGLLSGLVGGLKPAQVIGRDILFPAEGVHRSLRNGLFVGLVGGLFGGLVGGLALGLFGGLVDGLVFGLVVGPVVGLFVGLAAGLGAFLQHLSLRFWLWREGVLPFHLVPFLDDACARHLLKRVGGRYQFLHALLQDYFAAP